MLIHGAHGYLINRFLSPYTNRRTDQYGGTPANRARFALEIIQGIRKACGKGDPIVIRLSACEYLDYIGLPPEEGITLELAKQYCENLYSQPLHAVWPVFFSPYCVDFPCHTSVWLRKISLPDGKNPRPSGIPRL